MAVSQTNSNKLPTALRALRGAPTPRNGAHGDSSAVGGGADSPPERLAYSVAEAALLTGLSCDLLYDQMRTGRLAFVKVGRRRIIPRHDLEEFLARPA